MAREISMRIMKGIKGFLMGMARRETALQDRLRIDTQGELIPGKPWIRKITANDRGAIECCLA
jgi:hypothetical protein